MHKLKKIPEISPTFCVYPWMEIALMSHSKLPLCCLGNWHTVKDEKGRDYNLVEDHLEDYWNGYGLREIRKKMLSGEKLEECYWCNKDEEHGRRSHRQIHTKRWLRSEYGRNILERVKKSRTNGYRVEEPPLYLDIRPGNLCNLKCRMCGPASSSKIEQEQRELLTTQKEILKNEGDKRFLIDTEYLKINEKSWHKNKKVWKTIYKWAPELKALYITGGEPLLVKENWELINYLEEKGYSKDIHLMFNINCTQNPDKLIEACRNFRFVEIRLSVDGYKEVNEYIRYPSKWKTIEKNIIKILQSKRKNTSFYFVPVIQVYNVLDLCNLLKWMNELYNSYNNKIFTFFSMCVEPEFLDITILPKNIKKIALLKIAEYESSFKIKELLPLVLFNQIKEALKSEEKPNIEEKLKRFYKYTKLLDQHRGNSFEKTFPELNRLLDEDRRWKD